MSKDKITLTARADCRVCYGNGTFYERHGVGLQEKLTCDCVFADIPNDDQATWERINEGEFDIKPAPEGAA